MNIGGNFNYTSGTFTPGNGIVNYNGASAQIVAGLTYNHLAFNKSGGTATLSSSANINGDLTLSTSVNFLFIRLIKKKLRV